MIPPFDRMVEYNRLLTRKRPQLEFFTLKQAQTLRGLKNEISQITVNPVVNRAVFQSKRK